MQKKLVFILLILFCKNPVKAQTITLGTLNKIALDLVHKEHFSRVLTDSTEYSVSNHSYRPKGPEIALTPKLKLKNSSNIILSQFYRTEFAELNQPFSNKVEGAFQKQRLALNLFKKKLVKEIITSNEANYKAELLRLKTKNAQEKFTAERKKSIILFWAVSILLLLCTVLYYLNIEKIKRGKELKIINNELISNKQKLAEKSEELSQSIDDLTQSLVIIEESNKKLKNFSVALVHELITPINSMVMVSTILKKKFSSEIGKEGNSFLDYLYDEGKLVISLINKILHTSKIRQTVKPYPVDLNKVLSQTQDYLITDKMNASVQVYAKKYLGEVEGYDSEMHRVFMHIISFAIQNKKDNQKSVIEISGKLEKNNFLLLTFESKIFSSVSNGLEINYASIKNNREQRNNSGLKTCENILKNYLGTISHTYSRTNGDSFKVRMKNKRVKTAYVLNSDDY